MVAGRKGGVATRRRIDGPIGSGLSRVTESAPAAHFARFSERAAVFRTHTGSHVFTHRRRGGEPDPSILPSSVPAHRFATLGDSARATDGPVEALPHMRCVRRGPADNLTTFSEGTRTRLVGHADACERTGWRFDEAAQQPTDWLSFLGQCTESGASHADGHKGTRNELGSVRPRAHHLALHGQGTRRRPSSADGLIATLRDLQLAEIVPAPTDSLPIPGERTGVAVAITDRYVGWCWIEGDNLVRDVPPADGSTPFGEGAAVGGLPIGAVLTLSPHANAHEPLRSRIRRSHGDRPAHPQLGQRCLTHSLTSLRDCTVVKPARVYRDVPHPCSSLSGHAA